jgi:hypothetical protein
VVIATVGDLPGDLLVDARQIYWATDVAENGGSGAAYQVPESGGAPTHLADFGGPRLALDADYLYLAEGRAIRRVPRSGGVPAELVVDDAAVGSLAVHGSMLFWTNGANGANGGRGGGAVKMAPKLGGEIEVLASNLTNPFNLAVNGQEVYWTQHDNSGEIAAVAIDTRAVRVVAAAQHNPTDVELDSQHVYWTNLADVERADEGGVWRAPLGGGSAELVAPSVSPGNLVLSNTHVYWIDYHDALTSKPVCSTIRRAPLGGGPAELVAIEARSHVWDLAVEGAGLYWSNWTRREIKGGTSSAR